MIKGFDEYVKEKFDYTKQKNRWDWSTLKKGDIFYELNIMSGNVSKMCVHNAHPYSNYLKVEYEDTKHNYGIEYFLMSLSYINDEIVVDTYGGVYGSSIKMLNDLLKTPYMDDLKKCNKTANNKLKRETIKTFLSNYTK